MLRPGGRRFFQSRKRGLISFLLRLCWRARPKIRVRARSSILRIQHGPGFLHNQANFPSGRMKARAKSESAEVFPPRFESFPRESGGVCSRSAARRKTGAECVKRILGRTAKTCKFAHLLRPRAVSPSAIAPRTAAAAAGSGTCANPTCRAYPLSGDSAHRNTATPFSIPTA